MIFGITSNRLKPLSRIISIILIHTFVLSGIAFAVPQENLSVAEPIAATEVVTNPDNIVIPREFGLVKSAYNANSGKLIIHIQDAHCNYEAQSNIAKMLQALSKNDGLKLVAVEGADGVIDTSWFKAFPDAAIRKEVADYFMKKGEITGPEFLSITTDLPIRLFGAETREYYIQNLNAFTSSYPLKADTEKYFTTIKAALNRLKGFIYNEDLKEMDSKSADYESKKLPFNEYIRFLQAEAEKNRINLREYDNLFKLVNVLIYEKKIDFNVTDKERSTLIDALSKKLSKDQITDLVSQSIAFKIGKISSADYYSYLRNTATQNGVDLGKDYPNLYNYIIYNSVYSRIENEKLFHDITAVESAIKEKLFQNDDQRSLEKLSRHVETLLGLVNIKLLNGDFDYFKNHKDEFAHEVFTDFITKKSAQFGLAVVIDPPSDAIAQSIAKLEDFYAIAIKRDKALVDNALAQMEKDGEKLAVLVTGGFHSEGIAKLLEKSGISYLVVCPSITKDVPSPYIQVLTNQRTSFDDIVMGAGDVPAGQSMLAPAYLTWLARMPELERRETYLTVLSAAGPLQEGEESDLELRVEAFEKGFLGRELALYIANVLRYIGPAKASEEMLFEAVTMAFDIRLQELKSIGMLKSDDAVARLRARLVETPAFREQFKIAFAAVRAEAGIQLAQAKPTDNTERNKRTGTGPMFNADVNVPIRAAIEADEKRTDASKRQTLVIFDNGKVPSGVDPRYAGLIEILKSKIEELPDNVFDSAVAAANEPESSPLRRAFTKAGLLRWFEEGSGLRVMLIQPKDEVAGLRVPYILRTSENTMNWGHYSINRRDGVNGIVTYLPWGLIDRFLETGSPESMPAGVIGHELFEALLLKAADSAGAIDAASAQDITQKVHRIAQSLEVSIAGLSPSKDLSRSALDDELDRIGAEYLAALENPNAVQPRSERHEAMARQYIKGELRVPTTSFNRMLRMKDIPDHNNLVNMSPARRKELVIRAIDWFIQHRGKKFSISLLVAGEASRMQKGHYIPPILTDAQKSDPERFGRMEQGVDTTPQAKGLLPAGKAGERYVSFLETHLSNVRKMNNTFDRLGLGRPFIPKFMDNDKYHADMVRELERVADHYGFNPGEVIVFQQPLGWRVAASVAEVEAHKAKFIEEGGEAEYERALKYAREHQGQPIYDLSGTAEGHGEYFHSHLMPLEQYGGKTLVEINRDLGIEYDFVRNVDNMATLDENFLAIFGIMLEGDENALFEVSRRPDGAAGAGGGFVFDSDYNAMQIEDDVYRASVTASGFNRGDDENEHNSDGSNPSPTNNGSLFTRTSVFGANYGEEGELDRVLSITDPAQKAAKLADLRQAGRVKFGIVPTFKIVDGPDGNKIGTIIFETRAWDIHKGLTGKVGVACTVSAEDIQVAMAAEGLPVNEENAGTMSGLDEVRFDPLKSKADYGNAVLQVIRQVLARKATVGALISKTTAHLIVARLHQSDPGHLEQRIRTRATEIFNHRTKEGVTGTKESDWSLAEAEVHNEVAASSVEDQKPNGVGAIRANGGELPAIEHGTRGVPGYQIRDENSFNAALFARIQAGAAYAIALGSPDSFKKDDIGIDLGTPSGIDLAQYMNLYRLQELLKKKTITDASGNKKKVSVIIAKGLKNELKARQVAQDVLFHPGIGRGAVYMDESDLVYLLSLPGGADLIEEAIDHELYHIEHPEATEAEVEKARPTDNVRLALAMNRTVFAPTAPFLNEVTASSAAAAANMSDTIDTRTGQWAPPIRALEAVLSRIAATKGLTADEAVRYRDELQGRLEGVLGRPIASPLETGVFANVNGDEPLWVVEYSTDNKPGQEKRLAVINLSTRKVVFAGLPAAEWSVSGNILDTRSSSGNGYYQLGSNEIIDLDAGRAVIMRSGVGALSETGTFLSESDHRDENGVNRTISGLITMGQGYMLLKGSPILRADDIIIEVRRPVGLDKVSAQRLEQVIGETSDKGVDIVILKGLRSGLKANKIAAGLILHPGMGRRAIYMDEDDLLYLLAQPDDEGVPLLQKALNHEIAHFDNLPDADESDELYEARIERMAPTYNVRLALTLRNRPAANVVNRRYEEGQQYVYQDAGNVPVAGRYHRPIAKFSAFGTSGIRWLMPGYIEKLAANDFDTYKYVTSNGYTQEDFNLPNVGIIAKAIALYNIRKAKGYYQSVVGTTDDFAKRLNEKGILIAYDNRPGNPVYAQMIARVLTAYGIRAVMVRTGIEDMPTPIPAVSLMVRREGYAGSITLTASHNGDQWNGVKFETEDGAPATKVTTDAIGTILNEEYSLREPNYDIAKESVETLIAQGRISTFDGAAYYVKAALAYMGRERVEQVRRAVKDGRVSLKYSAFFGSSGAIMRALYRELGLPVTDIMQTRKPRGDVFVKSYEPTLQRLPELEEAVLSAGRQTRNQERPTIVIGAAADNDADRYQVNEYDPKTDKVEEFKPNRLAAILGHYLVQSRGLTAKDLPWGRSFVSPTYQDEVAKYFGQLNVNETATGFKFSPATLDKGKGVIFAEESYGMSFHDWTLDKDGMLPTLLALELVATTGMSLAEYDAMIRLKLRHAGLRYEFSFERDDMTLDKAVKESAIEKFKTFFDDIVVGQTTFAGQHIVKRYDPAQYEGGMKFVLEDGSWVALRASGTEPLIRLYREGYRPEDSERLKNELLKLTGLDMLEKISTDMAAPSDAGQRKVSAESARETYIRDTYVKEDEEALLSLLVSMGDPAKLDGRTVILPIDEALVPRTAAQFAEKAVNTYLDGKVIVVRGTGQQLLDNLRTINFTKLGKYTIVSSVTQDTLRAVGQNNLGELGRVLNVEPQEGTFLSPIALVDVMLRIGYDLPENQILSRLNDVFSKVDGGKFTAEDLHALLAMTNQILRLRPIRRINPSEIDEANKAAQLALQSL